MTRRFEENFLLQLFRDPLDPGYADAAARRAAEGPRPPWRRRGALVLRTVTLLVTGFLLAVAYHEAVAAEPDRNSAHAGLVDEVKSARTRTDDLQGRSDQLRRDVAAARESALGGSSDELRRIREQEAATGLGPVTGAGVEVRLADAPTPIDPTTGKPSSDAEVSRVLDVDIQGVVNGLWAAGAEAIAINDQRLTATSTIRAAGNAILVDFRPVTTPYLISAIGPDDLDQWFARTTNAANMRALADQYALGFSTRQEEELTLPAAPGRSLRYATPSPSPTGGTR